MSKGSSSAARAIAALALICGVVAIVVVVAASLSGGSGSSEPRSRTGGVTERKHEQRPVQAFYVVQTGDTLTAIAHKTGVSVARIQTLNPSIDPQILLAGEKLKLR